jgi:TRAP transporter 4TM/12TM fusion protein
MQKATEYEATRYETLPIILKIIFLIFTTIGVALAVFYIFGFSFRGQALMNIGYYYLLMALFSSSAFLVLPARKKDKRVPWYDLVGASLLCGIPIYFFLHTWEISQVGWIPASTLNVSLALVLCVLVAEGARRMAGPVYFVLCIIIGCYPLFANHMPGILYGVSFPFSYTISAYAFGTNGLLGLPSKVIGDILIGFLVFAAILIASGGGAFFLDLAQGLLGRFRGGPAKVAVVASALFGSMSGSAVSNVVATGSVTIPAMKRVGYEPHYAAAIEACSSTGGVLMPPVMGAVGFVIAVFLGMNYAEVLVAAAIPAILYYFGLLMQVDAYAAKVGLKGLPKEEMPSLRTTLKNGWPFVGAFAFLLWGLLYMRWEMMTPYYASGLLILLSFFRRATMMTPRRFIDALVKIGTLIAQSMAVILPISFIIGGLTITGTSTAFTSGLVALGGTNLWVVMLMGVAACYLLGMSGMMVAAYIFLAISLAPALVQLGHLNVLATHLFIAYYSMLAGITPPVAVAAFVGANIAGANPMKTAFQSMRLGVVIYFIPFFFIFNPSLILEGHILETVYLFALCLFGIALIAAGLEGYLLKVGKIGLPVRPLFVIAGFLISFPEWKTTAVGAVAFLIAMAITLIRKKHEQGKVKNEFNEAM